MIPPRRNRVDQRTYDEHLYKERHLVECFINKMKWYRRIFSRFEKLAARYFGFLSFVVLSPLLSGSVEMSTEPRKFHTFHTKWVFSIETEKGREFLLSLASAQFRH